MKTAVRVRLGPLMPSACLVATEMSINQCNLLAGNDEHLGLTWIRFIEEVKTLSALIYITGNNNIADYTGLKEAA